jgi:phosphoinositide-3-kinase regulatory subunit 4
LEKKRLDLTPPTLPELGQTGKKVSNSHPLNSNVQNTTGETRYAPDGTLVAHFTEHSKAVNDLQMSPDHLFFASCSGISSLLIIDDGTVKVWDTYRLHTNVTNRARLTYSNHGLFYLI